MVRWRTIAFYEGRFLVKTLTEQQDLVEAYRLRHKVFVDRLQWVPASPLELEVDAYDAWAISVGLFMGDGTLAGLFRILVPPGPFMLESEFRPCLLPGYRLRKEPDTVEITRLTVDPGIHDKGLSSRMMLALFKGVYQWSVFNDVRYLYMVVEKRFLRVLRAIGFPCEPISPAVALPPAGALSVAAVLDWDQFRDESAQKRPEFLRWITLLDNAEVRDEAAVPQTVEVKASEEAVPIGGELVKA